MKKVVISLLMVICFVGLSNAQQNDVVKEVVKKEVSKEALNNPRKSES